MDNYIAFIQKLISSSLSQKTNKFCYIIGNNGTGKSRVLNKVSEYQNQRNELKSVLCISNTVFDKFNPKDEGIVKYLGMRTVGNAIFFSAISRTTCHHIINVVLKNKISELEAALNLNFHFQIDKNHKAKSLEDYIDKRKIKNKILASILSSKEERIILEMIGKKESFSSMPEEKLNSVLKFLTLNPQTIKLIVTKNEKEYDFLDLSSGEQNRILLSSKILSSLTDKSLILIDEPEISLHLHWQLNFHDFISSIISKFHSVTVITATHSPIIVTEACKREESSALIILEAEAEFNDKKNEYRIIEHSSGKSFDEVVLDFFNTATYRSSTIDQEIAKILTDKTTAPEDAIISLKNLKNKTIGLYNKDSIINQSIKIIEKLKKIKIDERSND